MKFDQILDSVQHVVPNAKILRGINEYHIATNALLINAEKSNELMKELYKLRCIDKIEIINNYINIKFNNKILDLFTINYKINSSIPINIEFCSPNPTGDMHLGHLRSTIYGASLAKLYKHVYPFVTTDCYINNAGNQFKLFIQSLHDHSNNTINENTEYAGNYVKDYLPILNNDFSIENVTQMFVNKFKNTLNKLHIVPHDRFIYEINQYNNTHEAIEILQSKGYIKRGKITNQIDSDDKLIIQNIDGCNDFVVGHIKYNSNTNTEECIFTYVGYDIGYSYGKFKEGFKKQICCVGEDHIGHIQKMNNVMKYINLEISLEVVYTGIVKFEINEQMVKMSKRQGTFITIDSILESVHRNALLQLVFSHTEHQKLTIDINNFSENNIFIINYIYSEISKIENKEFYNDDEIIRYIIFWEQCIKNALQNKSIHSIYVYLLNFATYLYDNKLYKYILHEEVYNLFELGFDIIHLE